MIQLRRKQAQEANMQGRWQDEILLWEDLLALEPSAQDLAPLLKSPLTLGKPASNITQSIQQRLQIAQQNEQCAWMYTGAQQFIHNRDNAAARTQLQMLWQDAPYYGDPAGLSKVLGLPAALNYEQAIVAEQMGLERERQKQAKRNLTNYFVLFTSIILLGLGVPIVVWKLAGVVGAITMLIVIVIVLIAIGVAGTKK